MTSIFWFFVGFAAIYAAFCVGVIYGSKKAMKCADKIIDRYKKVANEAIDLVHQYIKGGDGDGV